MSEVISNAILNIKLENDDHHFNKSNDLLQFAATTNYTPTHFNTPNMSFLNDSSSFSVENSSVKLNIPVYYTIKKFSPKFQNQKENYPFPQETHQLEVTSTNEKPQARPFVQRNPAYNNQQIRYATGPRNLYQPYPVIASNSHRPCFTPRRSRPRIANSVVGSFQARGRNTPLLGPVTPRRGQPRGPYTKRVQNFIQGNSSNAVKNEDLSLHRKQNLNRLLNFRVQSIFSKEATSTSAFPQVRVPSYKLKIPDSSSDSDAECKEQIYQIKHRKPRQNHSRLNYKILIEKALLDKSFLTVNEIYNWLSARYEELDARKDEAKKTSIQNAIRHKLSTGKSFVRMKQRMGSGYLWTLADDFDMAEDSKENPLNYETKITEEEISKAVETITNNNIEEKEYNSDILAANARNVWFGNPEVKVKVEPVNNATNWTPNCISTYPNNDYDENILMDLSHSNNPVISVENFSDMKETEDCANWYNFTL